METNKIYEMDFEGRPIPFEAIHPGEILNEELKARNIQQTYFANQIGIRPSHLNDFIHGRRNMTENLALKLEDALNIPASFWMRMHYGYLYDLQAISERKRKEKKQNYSVAQVLQEAMNRYGYTNADVARLTAIDEKKIDAFTRGKAVPSLRMAAILCTVLSIAPSAMLGL